MAVIRPLLRSMRERGSPDILRLEVEAEDFVVYVMGVSASPVPSRVQM